MRAWEHPDWDALVAAYCAAEFGSEEMRLTRLAMGDAAEEVGDLRSAAFWRDWPEEEGLACRDRD